MGSLLRGFGCTCPSVTAQDLNAADPRLLLDGRYGSSGISDRSAFCQQ
jgi:hypothetical protein